jgi:hypothetical protein
VKSESMAIVLVFGVDVLLVQREICRELVSLRGRTSNILSEHNSKFTFLPWALVSLLGGCYLTIPSTDQ